MSTMVYTEVRHTGAVIHTPDGRRWIIDCVDVTEGDGLPDDDPDKAYEDTAVAYLSLVPEGA
jgi:hypothetical protein